MWCAHGQQPSHLGDNDISILVLIWFTKPDVPMINRPLPPKLENTFAQYMITTQTYAKQALPLSGTVSVVTAIPIQESKTFFVSGLGPSQGQCTRCHSKQMPSTMMDPYPAIDTQTHS
jgi:hypothetical protein